MYSSLQIFIFITRHHTHTPHTNHICVNDTTSTTVLCSRNQHDDGRGHEWNDRQQQQQQQPVRQNQREINRFKSRQLFIWLKKKKAEKRKKKRKKEKTTHIRFHSDAWNCTHVYATKTKIHFHILSTHCAVYVCECVLQCTLFFIYIFWLKSDVCILY